MSFLFACLPLLATSLYKPPPPTPSHTNFTVAGMAVTLTPSQTVLALHDSDPFNFSPPNGNNGFGTVSFRVRPASGAGAYTTLSTASGAPAVAITPPPAGDFAAAKMSFTGGLELVRHWTAATDGRGLRMWFELTNTAAAAVEIGAWGASMIFAKMGAQNNATLMAETVAMVDPSITGQHGFVSVTRITGRGAVLMVVPENGTDFQAYRPIDGYYEMTSLSKAYAENEWINSTGLPWLAPTSKVLGAGKTMVFGYRLLLADSVRDKDAALAKAGFAVMQAVPSCTIATDMSSALLHILPPRGATIKSATAAPPGAITFGKPTSVGTKGFFAVPVKGVSPGRARATVTYTDGTQHVASYFVLPPFDQHVARYGGFMADTAWYDNVSDPFSRGHSILAWNRETKQHIGVGAYDNGYEDNRIFNNGLSDEAGAGALVGFAAVVGGTAVPAQAAKLDLYINDTLYGVKPGLPFGASLQCVEGEAGAESPSCGPPSIVGPTTDGVMASMFWVPTSAAEPKMPGYDYDPRWFCDRDTPKDCPSGWPGWRWDQSRGASLGRAYNYAHVSSQYLGMYQAAEYDLLKTIRPRIWYLTRAYKTIVAMAYQASWYSSQGLMDGTNFWTVLVALQNEGMAKEAAEVEEIMRNRTVIGVHNQCRYYVVNNVIHDLGNDKPGCHWYKAENDTVPWASQTGLPGAGSEFAWDTTGQEEGYIWGMYFNKTALAMSALDQVLAFTPLVNNWGWHGSAFGMGDFGNNGYVRGDERELHHYRSGLNAIPSTEQYLHDPTDIYLLRLAAGSMGGVLTNIDSDGAPSMAFHSDPDHMFFDAASGDHGLAYYGHSHITSSFYVVHPDFGPLCYYCDIATAGSPKATPAAVRAAAGGSSSVTVVPRDSYRKKVHVGPLGLHIVSDAGTIHSVVITTTGSTPSSVTVVFSAVGAQPLSRFRLRLLTRSGSKVFTAKGLTMSRGGYDVKASSSGTTSVVVEW